MLLVPTLFFVDPWGYKGLTLQLINSVSKDWGCDAIIFFNYNRLNMGLSNLAVDEHMSALFTEKRAASLRYRLIDHLRQTPAKIKFLSLEPLLGPLPSLNLENIHWVIVGGESGPGARPIEVSRVIDIRNQCHAAGVPFFFKQ
jgi:Protein of unknown function (DUF5131)